MEKNKSTNLKKESRFFEITPNKLTVLLVLIGVFVPLYLKEQVNLSSISSWISAIVSGIAFIWLVYGYNLQRKSIDLQRIQVEKMGKFEAIKQIKDGIDPIKEKIKNLGMNNLNSIEDLPVLFSMTFAESAKDIVDNSTNEELKWDSMQKWTKVKNLCEEFLRSFVMFVKLYDESARTEVNEKIEEKSPENILDSMKNLNIDEKMIRALSSVVEYKDAWFVKSNIKKIEATPVLGQYSKTALALAEAMIMFEPGIDKIELEMLEEMEKTCPGCVKSDYLEKLRKKVQDRENSRKR
ncbi:MAG TPA: hypothetical protein PL195_08145 [bacterium]|nr:hypothetical protein [bacterium]